MNFEGGSDSDAKRELAPSATTSSGSRLIRSIVLTVIGVGLCSMFVVWFMREPEALDQPGVPKAIGAISSGDPAARIAAIREVAQLGLADSARSIPPVIKALADPDAAVRAQAAESLGILGSYAVWAHMTGNAADSDGEVTIQSATKGLLGAMATDTQSLVRSAAAAGLGNISATSPRAPRAKGARKGGGAPPAEPASSKPTPFDYQSVVSALIAALGDTDAAVRASAVTALGAAGPKLSEEPPSPLVAVLKDQSPAVRSATAKALSQFPRGLDSVIVTLIGLAATDDNAVRGACAQALRDIKPSAITAGAVPALVEALKNSDRDIRFFAIKLLARFGAAAKDAVPGLITVLNEPIASDRTTAGGGRALVTVFTGPAHEAAAALGKIAPGTAKSPDSIAALARVAGAGPHQRRDSAADALGEFGATAAPAIPDIVKMLEEGVTDNGLTAAAEVQSAARALTRIAADTTSSKAVVEALLRSLQSSAKKSRSTVVMTLRQLGSKAAAAAPAIESLKNDPDPDVRTAATKALDALDNE